MVSHVQLIHADKHGFLAIPEGDEKGLLDAVRFMDSNECNTMMAAARSSHGKPMDEVLNRWMCQCKSLVTQHGKNLAGRGNGNPVFSLFFKK